MSAMIGTTDLEVVEESVDDAVDEPEERQGDCDHGQATEAGGAVKKGSRRGKGRRRGRLHLGPLGVLRQRNVFCIWPPNNTLLECLKGTHLKGQREGRGV